MINLALLNHKIMLSCLAYENIEFQAVFQIII